MTTNLIKGINEQRSVCFFILIPLYFFLLIFLYLLSLSISYFFAILSLSVDLSIWLSQSNHLPIFPLYFFLLILLSPDLYPSRVLTFLFFSICLFLCFFSLSFHPPILYHFISFFKFFSLSISLFLCPTSSWWSRARRRSPTRSARGSGPWRRRRWRRRSRSWSAPQRQALVAWRRQARAAAWWSRRSWPRRSLAAAK